MKLVVINDIDFENKSLEKISIDKIFVENDYQSLIEAIKNEEKVIITWNSSTLIDTSLIQNLVPKSENYEIMFIANLPDYMEFEIWDSKFLIEKLEKYKTTRKPLRSILESIELDESIFYTDLIEEDIRLFRWELSPSSFKGRKTLEKIYEKLPKDNIIKLLKSTFSDSPKLITEIPTFYAIEISSSYIENTYTPRWKLNLEDITSYKFESIIDKIITYSKTLGIMIGIFNEPMLNPEFENILEVIKKYKNKEVSFIINTSLPYLPQKLKDVLQETKGLKGFKDYPLLSIFVDIPNHKKEKFESIKKIEFEKVISNLKNLLNIDKERVFIKFVRNILNDEDLPEFYETFKEYKIVISRSQIIDQNPIDTILLTRIPCYKLQSSIVILPNGEIPLCINDLKLENKLGNIFEDDLEEISTKKSKYYKEQLQGNFNGICSNCIVWDLFDL
ncbi:MAG: SPASM domain-containing protein [Brevinematia bacterium]